MKIGRPEVVHLFGSLPEHHHVTFSVPSPNTITSPSQFPPLTPSRYLLSALPEDHHVFLPVVLSPHPDGQLCDLKLIISRPHHPPHTVVLLGVNPDYCAWGEVTNQSVLFGSRDW